MKPDGSEQHRLVKTTTNDYCPVWQPDGKTIVFATFTDQTPQMFAVDIQGNNLQPFSLLQHGEASPAWSSDGRYMAYVAQKNGSNEIYVMNIIDGSRKQLTSDPADDIMPEWQP